MRSNWPKTLDNVCRMWGAFFVPSLCYQGRKSHSTLSAISSALLGLMGAPPASLQIQALVPQAPNGRQNVEWSAFDIIRDFAISTCQTWQRPFGGWGRGGEEGGWLRDFRVCDAKRKRPSVKRWEGQPVGRDGKIAGHFREGGAGKKDLSGREGRGNGKPDQDWREKEENRVWRRVRMRKRIIIWLFFVSFVAMSNIFSLHTSIQHSRVIHVESPSSPSLGITFQWPLAICTEYETKVSHIKQGKVFLNLVCPTLLKDQ